MTFSQFLSILRARRKSALLVFFGTLALVVLLSLALPKRYTAEASVVVDVAPDPINGAVASAILGPTILATQVDILTSDRVAQIGRAHV